MALSYVGRRRDFQYSLIHLHDDLSVKEPRKASLYSGAAVLRVFTL